MYKPIKHKLCSLCTHPRHWLQRTSLPCASEVSCTTEENILWEKGRRNHGKCLYLSLHTVNLISKGSKWWVTSRITAGQKKALSINERTGAEVKEEASIIQITYLHLIDVSYIRLCSSLFFFKWFSGCDSQWNESRTASENCDSAGSEAWMSLSFPVCEVYWFFS